MNAVTLTPDIVVLQDGVERAVLVCGDRYTTCVDLPLSRAGINAVLEASRNLTPEGLKTAILTREPGTNALPMDELSGVQIIRAERNHTEEWEWEDVPVEILASPEIPVHVVRRHKTVKDDDGHIFQIEPCLGSRNSLAVMIEPDDVLVCCDELHTELPPSIRSGSVHETLMRLQDWRLQAPKIIIPSSGTPIEGDAVKRVLDKAIQYVRDLYRLTRAGLTEAKLPWERLVYTIPVNQIWKTVMSDRLLQERHRSNVRSMALDINGRIQGEAEELSLHA